MPFESQKGNAGWPPIFAALAVPEVSSEALAVGEKAARADESRQTEAGPAASAGEDPVLELLAQQRASAPLPGQHQVHLLRQRVLSSLSFHKKLAAREAKELHTSCWSVSAGR